MSLFEYLTVAVSIVLALGLVRLVDGLRSASDGATRYWVHLGYIINLVATHLFLWWTLWYYQEGVNWNFARFVYVFLGPLILYFLASTLIPDNPSSVSSWRDHFYRGHRLFFLVCGVLIVHQALSTILLRAVPPKRDSWPGLALGVALSLVGASSKSERIHSFLVVAFTVAFLFGAVAVVFRPPVLR